MERDDLPAIGDIVIGRFEGAELIGRIERGCAGKWFVRLDDERLVTMSSVTLVERCNVDTFTVAGVTYCATVKYDGPL